MNKLIHSLILVLLTISCSAQILKGSILQSKREASVKCPDSCAMRNAVWTGKSKKSKDGNRYCVCDNATQPIPEAFNIYNTPLPHEAANHPMQSEYVIIYSNTPIPANTDTAKYCATNCQKKHAIWMNGPLSIRSFKDGRRCVCRYPLLDYESHHKNLDILGHVPQNIRSKQFCPSLCHSHMMRWNGKTTKIISGNSFYKKCNCLKP